MHHPYRKIGSLEGAAKRSPIAPNLQSIICLFLVVFDFRVVRIDDIIIVFLLLLSTLGARRTSQAAAATSPGYVPVFFTFRNDGSLLPGTQVDVYLLAADSREALAVPRSALVEQQGSYFIFEQVDAHGYKQVAVTLGVDNGEMVEVSSPMLKGGEVIVVEGATTVRLAGAAGAMPEGHSHNH